MWFYLNLVFLTFLPLDLSLIVISFSSSGSPSSSSGGNSGGYPKSAISRVSLSALAYEQGSQHVWMDTCNHKKIMFFVKCQQSYHKIMLLAVTQEYNAKDHELQSLKIFQHAFFKKFVHFLFTTSTTLFLVSHLHSSKCIMIIIWCQFFHYLSVKVEHSWNDKDS